MSKKVAVKAAKASKKVASKKATLQVKQSFDRYPTEPVAVGSLIPHPRNYKHHPEAQLAHLESSIKQYGIYRNVVIANDGTILAGHGVVEAVKRLGIQTVPVVRLALDSLSPEALKILALDNELGRFADSDDRALTELLREVANTDHLGLMGTGYDAQMLAALVMVTRPASEIAGFDAAAEWAGAEMPTYNPGAEMFRMIMQFRTVSDRKAFVDKYKIEVTLKTTSGVDNAGQTWSAWWPPRESEDAASVNWVGADQKAEQPKSGRSNRKVKA